MPRKPLTPEQRERKNAQLREKNARLKEIGLSSSQRRSLKKAIENDSIPESLLDTIGGLLSKPLKILDAIGEAVTGKPSSLGSESPTLKSSPPRKRRGTRGTSKKGAAARESFAEFIARSGDIGAKEAIRRFRQEGGSIGNERGQAIYRQELGKDRDVKKVTKIKYYSLRDYPLYGKEYHKQYIKSRYMYLTQFEVERDGLTETTTEWLHIASPYKLTYEEITLEAERAWDDGHENGDMKEMYRGIRIKPGSVELIRAVDIEA